MNQTGARLSLVNTLLTMKDICIGRKRKLASGTMTETMTRLCRASAGDPRSKRGMKPDHIGGAGAAEMDRVGGLAGRTQPHQQRCRGEVSQ